MTTCKQCGSTGREFAWGWIAGTVFALVVAVLALMWR